jgi:hypothetical protein
MVNGYIEKLINKIDNNEISEQEAGHIEKIPLGDNDLKTFYRNIKIILNGDLEKFNNIDELLPNNPDIAIILFRSSPNKGHWVLIGKYNDNFEYFDSYGYPISYPIKWVKSEEERKELNEYDFLTNIINNSSGKYNIIVNKYPYQNRKDLSIATCGRWCLLRAYFIKKYLMDLSDFKKIITTIRGKTGRTYDNIISDIIYLRKDGRGLSLNIEGHGKNKNTNTNNKFIKTLEENDINPKEYLTLARKRAFQRGYNPKDLNFSDKKNKKLVYNNINFGSAINKDFIFYNLLYKQGKINKEEPLKKQKQYLARATKIKGDWKDNKISPNNLAINILW